MGAYETKAIFKLIAKLVARSDSIESAYNAIADCAKDEGLVIPSYEDERKAIEKGTAPK